MIVRIFDAERNGDAMPFAVARLRIARENLPNRARVEVVALGKFLGRNAKPDQVRFGVPAALRARFIALRLNGRDRIGHVCQTPKSGIIGDYVPGKPDIVNAVAEEFRK